MARLLDRLNVARLALFPLGLGLALVLVTGTLNRVMIVELKLPASLVGLFFAMTLVVAPARAWLG
ncbi:MAG: PucC family protein, partial [Chloroflexota bacterium]